MRLLLSLLWHKTVPLVLRPETSCSHTKIQTLEMQQDAFQFNLKRGNQETLIKGLTSCKCRLSSLSSWLKQSRLLQQRRSTHKHAVKSSTTSGRRPPLSPVDLQKDMLWFCYSLTNSVCCFQGWSQKTTTKKKPKTLSCLQPAPTQLLSFNTVMISVLLGSLSVTRDDLQILLITFKDIYGLLLHNKPRPHMSAGWSSQVVHT